MRAIRDELPQSAFVFRTDVKSYYESIDHFVLLEQLAEYIDDRAVRNLLWQSMRRTVESGGLFRDVERGIARGSALSPLLGAFFLDALDQTMETLGVFYIRYMDDILVLAPTRWKLRKAIALVNAQLDGLGLAKHPDKTFVGRIEKGFDFLGYHFGRERLAVAEKTIANFVERVTRLHEQNRSHPDGALRLGQYVRRWMGWAAGGLAPRPNRSPVAEAVPRLGSTSRAAPRVTPNAPADSIRYQRCAE